MLNEVVTDVLTIGLNRTEGLLTFICPQPGLTADDGKAFGKIRFVLSIVMVASAVKRRSEILLIVQRRCVVPALAEYLNARCIGFPILAKSERSSDPELTAVALLAKTARFEISVHVALLTLMLSIAL